MRGARVSEIKERNFSRRNFLRATGTLGISGALLGASVSGVRGQEENRGEGVSSAGAEHSSHGGNATTGSVDTSQFDPSEFLRDIEGDRLRVVFKNNSEPPHTIHFHGFHPANMDGVFELVSPGREFTYEFDAEPFGMHLYHCHTSPLRKHIEKGLYGAFVIDPKEGRPEADEMVMVMNGFDTNFDGENEVYGVNTVAFHYQKNPIEIKKGELIRIYVVNMLEFDFINSFHTHANFFDYYPTGTKLEPSDFTDTKVFGQGERGIMEFHYDFPGKFMFHAHVSEFAELGWMGLFDVKE